MPRPAVPSPAVAACRARCTFPAPGVAVDLGVSGGPDSLALLVLAVDAGVDACAVHVDHGLRAGSGEEAAVVADAAERLGARFRAERAVVAPGPDLEARARTARHAVLGPRALLGHTADDRAEWVLLAALRGTGPDGLAALDRARHPLLDLRRSDTEAVCAAAGLDPVRDPTNDDARFTRNRVRHEVLPLLDDVAGRDVVPLLCRLADLAATDRDLLEDLAAALDPTDAAALGRAPAPLAARAVRRWLRPHLPAGHPPTAAATGRVLAVARGEAIGAEVGAGVAVRRTAGRLRIEVDGAAVGQPAGGGVPDGCG